MFKKTEKRPSSTLMRKSQGPSLKEKLTHRWGWLEHLTVAYERFNENHGNFYAGGITFTAVLALFPLVMITFSAAGLILFYSPQLYNQMNKSIVGWVSHTTHNNQLSELLQSAIGARTKVGVVGVFAVFLTGVNFVSALREALTVQWGIESVKENFFLAKLRDIQVALGILFGGLFVFVSAIFSANHVWYLIRNVFHAHLSLHIIQLISWSIILARFLLTWIMWTIVIAKIPRIQLPLKNALKAGLLNAVLINILTRFIGILIDKLSRNPILGVFIGIIAVMVLLYWTFRILLFTTAWAATAPENQKYIPHSKPPPPVIISPRIVRHNKVWQPSFLGTLFRSEFKNSP